jgi:rubrerythrin
LKFAEGLERGAATAYLGVIPTFKDRDLARLTASILSIETTHVTTLAAALQEQTAYKLFVS